MFVLLCVTVFLVVAGLSARVIQTKNKGQSNEVKTIAHVVTENMQASMHDELKSTIENSFTILDDIFRLKRLSNGGYQVNRIAVRYDDIYYQRSSSDNFYSMNNEEYFDSENFLEPSFFGTLSIRYPEPGHLIFDQTVIRTEETYDRFRVAHHLAKKIYFKAWNSTGESNGNLYAAYIGTESGESVAEKIDMNQNVKDVKDVAVDQFTGDIVIANYNNQIYKLQKIPYYYDIEAIAKRYEAIKIEDALRISQEEIENIIQ